MTDTRHPRSLTPPSLSPELTQDERPKIQTTFQWWTHMIIWAVLFGALLLATPVLFILAAIGSGPGLIKQGGIILTVWIALIVCAFFFARVAKKCGYTKA